MLINKLSLKKQLCVIWATEVENIKSQKVLEKYGYEYINKHY